MNSNKNEISEKSTIFHIILDKVSFMTNGLFQLKLTIISSNSNDKSGVRLRTGNSEKFIRDYSVKTEILGPIKDRNLYNFESGEYNFYLPKGFCQNNINYDVYLLVETLSVSNDSKTKLIGVSKLPIYPRSDVIENYRVEIGDPFYQFKGMARLLKKDSGSSELHCGELHYQSELSEIREIFKSSNEAVAKLKQPKSPNKTTEVKPIPLVEVKPSKKLIEVSSSPINHLKVESTNLTSHPRDGKTIEFGASPLPYFGSPIPKEILLPPRDSNHKEEIYHLLAPKDHEEISIFIHGGEHVLGYQNKPTNAYVSCSFKTNLKDDYIYDSTHVTSNPTSVPYWEEILNIPYETKQLETVLSLNIIDNDFEYKITEYLLPIKTLKPFIQHHLKLCQKTIDDRLTSILYVTIIRKLDHYLLTGEDVKFSAFIIKPLKFMNPRKEKENHHFICFAYLSNDHLKTRKMINCIEEHVTTVSFPLASNFNYSNPKKLSMMSAGQLTIPTSITGGFDTFNFPFLFCQQSELDTCFTSHSFIIFDFYETQPATGMDWRHSSPVARSVLPLDNFLFRQLDSSIKPTIKYYDVQKFEFSENDKEIKLNKSNDEQDQQLIVKLWLINQNISDSLSPENIPEEPTIAPVVDPVVLPEVKKEVTYDIMEKKKEPFLYSINPVKEFSNSENLEIQDNLPTDLAIYEMISRFLKDANNSSIYNKQPNRISAKPNNKFRESFKKMQLELTNLRNQINQLQIDNQKLEAGVSLRPQIQNMKSNNLKNLQNLSRNELFKEYDKLRHEFGSQISEVSHFKAKQEDLSKALTQRDVKDNPIGIIEKLQMKTKYQKKLEHEVMEKERRIVQLENQLYGKNDKVEKAYEKLPDIEAKTENDDDDERNELYCQLEKAENRINSLQNQLVDIARKRGSNRQMIKIKEAEKLYR